jgi:diguanylate cyclase (GGDEF)-like protein
MSLDIHTLLVVLTAIMIATAVGLPVIMGRRVSAAARCFQAAVGAQMLGWLCLMASARWADRWFSSLAMALLAASFALVWQAAQGWLGGRPFGLAIRVCAVAIPLGYVLLFPNYAWRVGWSNFGFAIELGLLVLALLRAAPRATWRWRAPIVACLSLLIVTTVWRGVLGAFYTDQYASFRTPHPVNLAATVLNSITMVLTTLAMLVAWRDESESELRTHAHVDALTGLMNRRAFEQRAGDALSVSRRYHDPLALMLLDLDHFKQINDRRGHAGGDQALQAFARLLQACTRRGDLACRWGGEEFCVLLLRADATAARAFDTRLRRALANAASLPEPLGYSAGLALVSAGEQALDEVVRRADAALYRAKSEGRGRLAEAEPMATVSAPA